MSCRLQICIRVLFSSTKSTHKYGFQKFSHVYCELLLIVWKCVLWNFNITSSMAFSLPQRVNDIFTDNLHLVPWSTPGCICLQLKVPDKESADKFALNLSSCSIACTYYISNLFSLQFIQQITTKFLVWMRQDSSNGDQERKTQSWGFISICLRKKGNEQWTL